MNDRLSGIEIRVEGTCEWLLRHTQWKRWMSSDRLLLWIKGKPGSGKSTLLHYALEKSRETKAGKKALLLSFFFYGRGHDLQRSPLGLFRSLLHQVLVEHPDALKRLVATFKLRCDGSKETGATWEWELDELRRFFERSILDVLKSRPVWIFIDALDECGAEGAKHIIQHFKNLLQGPSTSSQFRICFSCRHYPTQNWDAGLEICVEHQNRKDILTYLQTRLSDYNGKTRTSFPELVAERSNGLFIWARLVADRILGLDIGDNLSQVEDKINATIESVPQNLRDLYAELFRGMEKRTDALKLIEWVHFAQGALTLDALRWAMVVDTDCRYQSLEEYKTHADYTNDNDVMERKVKRLSHGLVEIVPSSTNVKVVQFIHQSVKDFLDDKGRLLLGDNDTHHQPSAGAAVGAVHYRLFQTCARYLTMEEISRAKKTDYDLRENWFSNLLFFSSSRSSNSRFLNCLLSDFPLLEYATRWWVTHLQASQTNEICPPSLLDDLDWPSERLVGQWVRMFQILGGSQCPPRGIGLIHIASRYDLREPLSMILERAGSSEINSRDVCGRTPLIYAAERGHRAAAEALLEHQADANAKDFLGATALHYAASRGHPGIVALLLETGADIDAKDNTGCTPLGWAVETGRQSSLRALLDKNPDLNYLYTLKCRIESIADHEKAYFYYPPIPLDSPSTLWMPSACLQEVASSLNDSSDRTPLLRAVELGQVSIVKMLLEKGVSATLKVKLRVPYGHRWICPLWVAQQAKNQTLIEFLEEH